MTDDEVLRQAWEVEGRLDLYDGPTQTELDELSNSRSRGRAEKKRRKRLKANRQLLAAHQERRHAADAQAEPAGAAVPHYLLDRGKYAAADAAGDAGYGDETSSGGESDEDSDRREERRQERREECWSSDPSAWRREQEEARAWHGARAAEWDAAHGARREAEHRQLVEQGVGVRGDVYWALACEPGRRPKWRLRSGEQLEADATHIVADDDPLPLYQSFRPFRSDGNMLKALQACAGPLEDSELTAWLNAERALLETSPTEATRPSGPRCIECGGRVCVCAQPDAEWYEHGGSADMHYMGAADHERLDRLEQYERVVHELLEKGRHGPIRLRAVDSCEEHTLQSDRIIEETGRISAVHGRPMPHYVAPVLLLDDAREQAAERARRERARREEREHRERLERMQREAIPPPRRDDERYGPRASNPAGDESFRLDRKVWYEHVTGESLDGLDLADQWERVDVIARRFRSYSDGRTTRPVFEAMPPELQPPRSSAWCAPASEWRSVSTNEDGESRYACPLCDFRLEVNAAKCSMCGLKLLEAMPDPPPPPPYYSFEAFFERRGYVIRGRPEQRRRVQRILEEFSDECETFEEWDAADQCEEGICKWYEAYCAELAAERAAENLAAGPWHPTENPGGYRGLPRLGPIPPPSDEGSDSESCDDA